MTKEETDVAIQTYVESIKVYLPNILTIAMTGSVIYCISTVLMMIGSLHQKIRGLMIPYIILQCYLGINLFVCSIVVNLTSALLRYPHLELVLLFGSLSFVLIIGQQLHSYQSSQDVGPYLACFCSVTFLISLSVMSTLKSANIVLQLSLLTTFYLPMPFLWCLLKAKQNYVFMDRTTGVSNIRQSKKES